MLGINFKSKIRNCYNPFHWAPPPDLNTGTCCNSSQDSKSEVLKQLAIQVSVTVFSAFIVVWPVSRICICCTVSDEVPKPSSIKRMILHLIFHLGNVFKWSCISVIKVSNQRQKNNSIISLVHTWMKWVVVQNCSSFFSAQLPIQVMKVILPSMHQYYWHIQH
jgi:hypothetical protein